MDLIIISGRSGSGKTTALHQLEDDGYFAIDNLPASLLPALVRDTTPDLATRARGIAVCIDARNVHSDLRSFAATLERLPDDVRTRIVYLDADDATLIKRFSETRRPHPLASATLPLADAIGRESQLLESLAAAATLTIDTRDLTIYELRDAVRQRLVGPDAESMTVLVESFGFKRGMPHEADLVFDLRMLPNPHWAEELRSKTGLDPAVAAFLESHEVTNELFQDIARFVERWIPVYEESSRSYLTVAVGCTGGQHRSVYMANRLHQHLQTEGSSLQVQLRHRELASGPFVPS